ncbi:MAG: hypothetical protein ACO1PW_06050 [Actinomycetota bacterium]
MASSSGPVALGMSDHTGWAVVVAVAGDPRSPEILLRRRIELVDPALPRQAFHAAADRPLTEAARLIDSVSRSALAVSADRVGDLVGELRDRGRRVAGLAVAEAPEVPDDLAAALAKHPLLHAGEAAIYREALAEAATEQALPVTRFPPGDALGQAAALLRTTSASLDQRLRALRVDLGAPWAADHRNATAAALLVLAAP